MREPEEILSPEKVEDLYLDTVDDIPSGDSDKKSDHSPFDRKSEVPPSSDQKSENPFDFPILAQTPEKTNFNFEALAEVKSDGED